MPAVSSLLKLSFVFDFFFFSFYNSAFCGEMLGVGVCVLEIRSKNWEAGKSDLYQHSQMFWSWDPFILLKIIEDFRCLYLCGL